jgi:hypothetical protein
VAKLVFDIETSALPLDQYDAVQHEYLFRDSECLTDPVAKEARRVEIARLLNLWPMTAQVVCIAMLNADSLRGKVFFLADDFEHPRSLPGSVDFVACSDEAELLNEFWEVAIHYDSIITFNGRGFDVPFLYMRSALLNVQITRKDWLGYRYNVEPHCDLLEQLTFYGVSGREGAGRRFNLDFYCKAFGLESPKNQGITGMDINELMAQGRQREIAEYCMRDVYATMQLYKIWKDRLSTIK